ncbi:MULTISPECIES: hypothetical protein [unclassified Bradyrhizobium]|uniref:hypothetical protein n=1 Tax=unclassified Bradyrhizobium TaxID=2631580 RepID=UPI002FF0D164
MVAYLASSRNAVEGNPLIRRSSDCALHSAEHRARAEDDEQRTIELFGIDLADDAPDTIVSQRDHLVCHNL